MCILINKKLYDYRLKQKILYIDKVNPNVLQNYGDLFLEEGLLSDALDFYQKANYNSGMQKIKDIAFDKGDVMLFQQVTKALHLELKPADWEDIGQKAIDLKKYFFAQHALEKADNEEMLNSLKKIMQNEGDGKSA
jgi:tetratricopeptide (TPR) repeat protein